MVRELLFYWLVLWWAGFAQITFARVPETKRNNVQEVMFLKKVLTAVKKVYNQIKTMPVLKRFLRGFFFYSMGVQTVMLAATLFGSKLLQLADTKLIITVVIIQLVAIAGAILMSRFSERVWQF